VTHSFARRASFAAQRDQCHMNHTWHGLGTRIEADARNLHEPGLNRSGDGLLLAEATISPNRTITGRALPGNAPACKPRRGVSRAARSSHSSGSRTGWGGTATKPTMADRSSVITSATFQVVLNLNHDLWTSGRGLGRNQRAKAEALACEFRSMQAPQRDLPS